MKQTFSYLVDFIFVFSFWLFGSFLGLFFYMSQILQYDASVFGHEKMVNVSFMTSQWMLWSGIYWFLFAFALNQFVLPRLIGGRVGQVLTKIEALEEEIIQKVLSEYESQPEKLPEHAA